MFHTEIYYETVSINHYRQSWIHAIKYEIQMIYMIWWMIVYYKSKLKTNCCLIFREAI